MCMRQSQHLLKFKVLFPHLATHLAGMRLICVCAFHWFAVSWGEWWNVQTWWQYVHVPVSCVPCAVRLYLHTSHCSSCVFSGGGRGGEDINVELPNFGGQSHLWLYLVCTRLSRQMFQRGGGRRDSTCSNSSWILTLLWTLWYQYNVMCTSFSIAHVHLTLNGHISGDTTLFIALSTMKAALEWTLLLASLAREQIIMSWLSWAFINPMIVQESLGLIST